ncbi:MATE family efflux transporter [Haloparvum alkalitolerans]|uniref:MATE family efflux transporter n=1 Tax=Haloparvum alkalitolerans TaxID=1042953 RepID=UPI003CF4FF34
MVALAWPMVVIQLLQVAYNVADTAFLGAYSADAVAALSLAFPIVFFLISIGGGFTAAGAILIAQYSGAGADRDADRIAGQTLVFVTLVAVAVGAIGYVVTDPMLALLPADAATQERIVPMASAYMRVFFLGTPFLFGFFVFVSLMRGYGDTRTPMRVMVVSVAVNVALDPLLIFGIGPFPALDVQGAALATVFSRFVATVLGLYVLFGTGAGPDIRREDLTLNRSDVGDIVRLGVPSAVEQSASSLAFIALTAIVVTFSPPVVAAYGLGNRIVSLVFLPALGLSQAVDTVVGKNLGAERPDRAERGSRLAMAVTAGVMALLTAVVFLVPAPIAGVFLTAEGTADALAYSVEYLQIAAFMFVPMGVLQILLGTFRGAGNTKTAMLFSVATLWVVRVPATYLLAFTLGWAEDGIWLAVVLGDVVGCLLALAWYGRGTWSEKYVDETAIEAGSGPTADE